MDVRKLRNALSSAGRALRRQRGQVFAFTAISMVGICGMAGFSIDVSSWYQAHRKQQAVADASALAGAGSLPAYTSQAVADAQTYAVKNGGSVAAGDVTFSTKYLTNDTITVRASKAVPSYFLKVISINGTTVTATAVARAEALGSAWGSAPFAVIDTEPELSGPGCPCLGVPTTLDLLKVGPGGFKVLNIDGSRGGTGSTILADWILNGCDCSTDTPRWLFSDAGAKFNPSQVQDAMTARVGSDLLFPVYDVTRGGGSGMEYHIIGFTGFHLTGFDLRSSSGTIDGYFVKLNWRGTGSGTASNYFGATMTMLVG